MRELCVPKVATDEVSEYSDCLLQCMSLLLALLRHDGMSCFKSAIEGQNGHGAVTPRCRLQIGLLLRLTASHQGQTPLIRS